MRILSSVALVLLAVIAAMVALATFKKPPQDRPQDKWSYTIVTLKGFSVEKNKGAVTHVTLLEKDLPETLNRMGADNWELVSALRETINQGSVFESYKYDLIMKRRLIAPMVK